MRRIIKTFAFVFVYILRYNNQHQATEKIAGTIIIIKSLPAVLELEHGNQFPDFRNKSVSDIYQRIDGDCKDMGLLNIKTSVLKYFETIQNGKISRESQCSAIPMFSLFPLT